MSRHGKIIIAIAVVLLVVVIAAVATSALRPQAKKSGDPYDAACRSLIAAITAKDYDAGYKLLSSTAKNITSRSQWQESTSVLGNIYIYGQTTFVSRNDIQPAERTDQTFRAQMTYTVKSPAVTSKTSCTVVKEGENYVVDGFYNEINDRSSATQ